MNLSRIVMRLARNPGTEFADGDDHRGYTLTAPLTDDGKIDEAGFRAAKTKAVVRRFAPADAVHVRAKDVHLIRMRGPDLGAIHLFTLSGRGRL